MGDLVISHKGWSGEGPDYQLNRRRRNITDAADDPRAFSLAYYSQKCATLNKMSFADCQRLIII